MLKFGQKSISQVKLGQNNISRIYLGQKLVWSEYYPYDAKVEYIQSAGDEYINTLYVHSVNTSVDIEVEFLPASISASYCAFFGARRTNTSSSSSTYTNQMGGWLQKGYFLQGTCNKSPSSKTTYMAEEGKVYEVQLAKTEDAACSVCNVTDSGEPVSLGTGNGNVDNLQSTDYDLIFAINQATSTSAAIGPQFKTAMKCYSCKIWTGGVLERNFIPVRFTNESGASEGAMYDKVSKQLFRNAGTGSFIIGPDK